MMLEAKKILLVGAGGHCLSVLDSLLSSYNYQAVGIVLKDHKKKDEVQVSGSDNIMGIPIVGNDDDLKRLYLEGYTEAFVAVGSIGDVSLRKKLYQLIKNSGFNIPNIIDKTSIVSPYANLGEGIYIGKNAVVNAYANIGNFTIINTSSIIEHECIIKDYVHIAPGSIISGKVFVGENTHIGAGSVIKQGIHVGSSSMIGMGSVVLRDIRDRITAFGNPCEEVKHE